MEKIIRKIKFPKQIPELPETVYRCQVTDARLHLDHNQPPCATHVDAKPQSLKTLKDIPGPRGLRALPFIGFRFLFKPFSKFDIRTKKDLFKSLRDTYGPVVKVRAGPYWFVHLFDPDDIETVFRADSKYPFRFTFPLLAAYESRTKRTPSLLSLNGEEWLKCRQPLSRMLLRPTSVAKYNPAISVIADDFIQTLDGCSQIDNLPYTFMQYTTEGAGLICFNTRLGAITGQGQMSEIMRHADIVLDCIAAQFRPLFPWFVVMKTPFYRKFETSMEFLYREAEKHIKIAQEKLQHHEDGDVHDNKVENSLLYDLLTCPDMPTDKAIRNLVDTFIGAIDSTANTMTFMMYLLAKYPDVQEKLYREITQVYDGSSIITSETLANMPYMKACFKESLRVVFPLDGGTLRCLNSDIVLKGFKIPKGTYFQNDNAITVMDAKYFDDPEEFRPERWLDANRANIHPFAYIPFGHGPRKCLGQRFAEQEVHILFAKLLSKYHVGLPEGVTDVPYQYHSFVTPVEPVSFTLRPRQ